MDDLNKKNERPDTDDLESKDIADERPEQDEASEILKNLDSREKQENEIPDAKVQDWDGLIDNTPQEAEMLLETEESAQQGEAYTDSTDADEADVTEIDEADLCVRCEKRARFTELDPDYEYCKACRDELKRTPMNWKGIVMFLITGIMFVFAVCYTFTSGWLSVPVIKGDYYTAKNHYQAAYNCYSEANNIVSSFNQTAGSESAQFDVGMKTVKKTIKNMYYSGYVQQVSQAIDQYFTEDALNKAKNADILAIKKDCDEAIATINGIQSIYAEYTEIEKPTQKDMETYIGKLEEKKGTEGMQDAYISYYQYVMCLNVKGTEDTRMKYLLQIKEQKPESQWFYAESLYETYIGMGEMDKAMEVCEDYIRFNWDNVNAYVMKASAYRRQEQYDKGLEVCKEALDIDAETPYNTSSEFMTIRVYQEQAVLYALKGDMEKAQEAVDTAYGNSTALQSMTVELANVYALISGLNGKTDQYNAAKEMLEGSDLKIADLVDQCIAGKASLRDIFVEGEVQWF